MLSTLKKLQTHSFCFYSKIDFLSHVETNYCKLFFRLESFFVNPPTMLYRPPKQCFIDFLGNIHAVKLQTEKGVMHLILCQFFSHG